MNDAILAEQLAKTGNLLDLLADEAWVQETETIEAECCGQVEAGLGLQSYVEQLSTVSPETSHQQHRQVQLLSILLPELKTWLDSWELGLSLGPVYIEAQRRLFKRLQQPKPDQVTWLDALLAGDTQPIVLESKPVRQQAIAQQLSQIFTEEDWQALAKTAAEATEKGILHIRQREMVQVPEVLSQKIQE